MNDYSWSLSRERERVDDDYLAHHGIMGMKWGVRRYQNDDGSLTAEGRTRYGIDSAKGTETKKSRMNRSVAAARYEEKADKYRDSANKAKAKGNTEKYVKLSNKENFNRKASNSFAKGLNKDEREFGRQQNKVNKRASTGASAGYVIAGPVGAVMGALGANTYSSIFDSNYKNSVKAFNASYEKYANTRVR